MPEPLHLKQLLPGLALELEAGLRKKGEHALASSVDFLQIHDLCECSDSSCGSFNTGPRPEGAFGGDHRNIPLDPTTGMTILDVVDGVIRYVELIDRPEIHAALGGVERAMGVELSG